MVTQCYEPKVLFDRTSLIPHNFFPHVNTIDCSNIFRKTVSIELESLRLVLHGIEYLEVSPEILSQQIPPMIFQQDTYRLWYQIYGSGIIQNVSLNTFGSARPGLLGVMDRGQRHIYLHQRGHFACFQIFFSLHPSLHAKCYWNSAIEGKTILDENDRLLFENHMQAISMQLFQKISLCELLMLPKLLEIINTLFNKGLIIIEESRFPKNKAKSLVSKAKCFMDSNYSDLRHQDALVKECGVDINYLNILFKKETGMTLYDYLTSVRMEHAKYLLETTHYPISDIAARSGYSNVNSFCRAFKRNTSSTPQEFRYKHHSHSN